MSSRSKDSEREARLAAALRANLKRRKSQTRGAEAENFSDQSAGEETPADQRATQQQKARPD